MAGVHEASLKAQLQRGFRLAGRNRHMSFDDTHPFRVRATVEELLLAAALFWLLSGNQLFLGGALQGRSLQDPSAWGLGLALALMVVALHLLLVGLLATRHTVKPLVAVLTLVTASTAWFMSAYGVVIDPAMLRNVLHTDTAEAKELLGPPLALHLLIYAGLPLLLLWRVQIEPRPWRRALAARSALLLTSAAVLVGALLAVYQPLSSLMRNHRDLRYRVTPVSALWSTGVALAADARGAARPREAIGTDAHAGPSWAARNKPMVVVVVVGETARAANWGLNGYARDTTPRLRTLPVVNFGAVGACGTSTEVSLPCMFAPVGRRDIDEAKIRGQQSLLHVLARAGVAVHWRDNQSGCKGVCEGLPTEQVDARMAPGLCDGDHCLDEGLVLDFDERLSRAQGTQVWVLHMLGNHGPAYHRRHPPAFSRFQPECRSDDLRQCPVEQIVNAYDNALLYTDHVLARAVERLAAHADRVDSAFVYVSDHGESLGEMGLFLHGVPYAIAPAVQREVPMVMWASPGFERAAGLQAGCLTPTLQRQAAAGGVRHDHLFHTLLGLLDVHTSLHESAFDLSTPCQGTGRVLH
jgi:lipid A ethanolaminephosphotransferase